jgi:hypothetical protein
VYSWRLLKEGGGLLLVLFYQGESGPATRRNRGALRCGAAAAPPAAPDDPVFIVPATPNLFVYFSVVPDNGFLLEDFVRPGRLEHFLGTRSASVAQT